MHQKEGLEFPFSLQTQRNLSNKASSAANTKRRQMKVVVLY